MDELGTCILVIRDKRSEKPKAERQSVDAIGAGEELLRFW